MSDIIRLREKGRLGKPEDRTTIKLRDKEQLLRSLKKQAVLVVDGSGSMTASKKQFATTGAVQFSRGAVEKKYTVGVVGFAETARLICKPTGDLDRLRKACACWPVSGGTFMGAGLLAAQKLKLEPGDVIVVVTDGQCGQPDETLSIASRIKASGVEILAIGTDDADQTFLKQLASRPDLGLKVEVARLSSAIGDASRLLKG